jgi:hypothetical protein
MRRAARSCSWSRCCRWATRMRCRWSTTSRPHRWPSSGPLIEHHPRFPQRVNAGFMQVVDRRARPPARVRARRRRDAGLRHRRLRRSGGGHPPGALDRRVDVQTHGGILTIEWHGQEGQPVLHDRPGHHRVRGPDRHSRRWPEPPHHFQRYAKQPDHEPDHRRRHRRLPDQHARILRAPFRSAGRRCR